MSATGRGAKRREADFYPTPGWCTRAILPRLPLGGPILEPTAGDGAIVKVLLDAGVPSDRIQAVEFDPGRAAACGLHAPTDCADFLAWDPSCRFGAIIGNPPFSLALPIARRCVEIARGAPVALLLRLAWAEPESTGEREALLRETRPEICLIPRPSFTGGPTDMAAYAWFLWNSSTPGAWGYLDAKRDRVPAEQASLFSNGAP